MMGLRPANPRFALDLRDLADPDLRIMRTMTVFLPETFPSLHLEGDHLVTLYMVEDLGLDDSLHILADG